MSIRVPAPALLPKRLMASPVFRVIFRPAILFLLLRDPFHTHCRYSAVNGHGHIASTKHYPVILQFIYPYIYIPLIPEHYIVPSFGFQKGLLVAGVFAFRIIDLKHFSEFIFCPKIVSHTHKGWRYDGISPPHCSRLRVYLWQRWSS